MATNLRALKIAAEKVELIQDTLNALDEATTLIAAFTQTKENEQLLSQLLSNIDEVRTIVNSVDLMKTTTEDIGKGTYLGNRKIDIDIALNKIGIADSINFDDAISIWNNTTNTVYYDKATVTFVDGVIVDVLFVNDDGQPIQVSTHGAIIDQLMKNTTFTNKLENTSITEEVGGKIGSIIRIADVTGSSSNVERIKLNAVVGAYAEATPIYFWAKTTSALQTLANRVGDIIKLGNDIDSIIALSTKSDEIQYIYDNKGQLIDSADSIYVEMSKLVTLYNNITGLIDIYTHITNINSVAGDLTNIDSVATNVTPNLTTILDTPNQAQIAIDKASEASASATSASNSATVATQQADIATQKNQEIKAISVANTITGAAGTQANVIYDNQNNAFTFIVPQGVKGDKGDNFNVNAVGHTADRALYDDKLQGFSFLDLDTSTIYFKLSDTSGDWSAGAPFGKGDKGDKGDTGVGIANISFTSTTDASGNPAQSGATDTYTITYTDSTTSTFNVYNGLDSAVLSVAGRTGDVVLTSADVGLGNVDNTADVDKPIGTATQSALDLKADINQDINTTTKYTDAASALNYKIYVDNGEIVMEEL